MPISEASASCSGYYYHFICWISPSFFTPAGNDCRKQETGIVNNKGLLFLWENYLRCYAPSIETIGRWF